MFDEAASEQYIEQLARLYRIRVYNTFRTDRAQYNQHRAAWRQTLGAWLAAGSPADSRDDLIAWLRQATLAVESAPPGPIPARPGFDAKVVRKPIEQSPKPDKIAPTIKPPVQKPPVQKPATAQRNQTLQPSLPKVDEITTSPSVPATAQQPGTVAPMIEPPAKKTPLENRAPQPGTITPDITLPGITPPSKPSIHAGKAQPPGPRRPAGRKPGAVEKPAPTGRQTTQIPTLPTFGYVTTAPSMPSQAKRPKRIAPRVSPPRRNAAPSSLVPPAKHLAARTKRPASPRTLADRRAWGSPKRAAATRTKPPKTDSSLGRSSLGRSRTLPTLPGLLTKYPAGLDNKIQKGSLAAADDSAGQDSDTEVNLIELAARIAGTNMNLRGVEAQLTKDHKWDATQLAAMVDAIKQLSNRRDDLTLFRNLLPESERRLVGELESPRAAISQCSARIAETRARVDSRGSINRPKEREQELQKLDELSRQLAKLVTGS